MNKIKQNLFIKAILAEESMNSCRMMHGEGMETHLKQQNYYDLLDLIEEFGWFEEYRSFKIMAALYAAQRDHIKCLPSIA